MPRSGASWSAPILTPLGGCDRDGRPGRQEAWRRADVAVRPSGGAGERFRACSAGGAVNPALACRVNRNNAGSGKPSLTARIGLETGPVVVDAAGEIYGDAPNVAARVQALAEPVRSWSRLGYSVRSPGCLLRKSAARTRSRACPSRWPCSGWSASGVGRRWGRQLAARWAAARKRRCCAAWERARQGDGQLMLIVGEPGLGKSRLIKEFHARLSEVPLTWVEWGCSQLPNSPLHPIAEWGRQRFGGADCPLAASRRVESSLAQVNLDPAESIRLLAPLLNSAAAGTGTEFGSGGVVAAATGGADELGHRRREGPAAGAGVRGSALG